MIQLDRTVSTKKRRTPVHIADSVDPGAWRHDSYPLESPLRDTRGSGT